MDDERRSRGSTYPSAIGALTNLRTLDISYNAMKTLPDSLYALGKLRELRAKGVPLTTAVKAALAKRLPNCTLVEK